MINENNHRMYGPATTKADATTGVPAWLRAYIARMPYSFRYTPVATLKRRLKVRTDAELHAKLEAYVSRIVRPNALEMYGPDHPQAQPDYVWKPLKTDRVSPPRR